jgi:hypothetical protein
MTDLLSGEGSLPTEEQLKGKVSRRGFLRLAAVAAGGSVAALACSVDPTAAPSPLQPIRRRCLRRNPRPGSGSARVTLESKLGRWNFGGTGLR